MTENVKYVNDTPEDIWEHETAAQELGLLTMTYRSYCDNTRKFPKLLSVMYRKWLHVLQCLE